jgi:hypothetical protein
VTPANRNNDPIDPILRRAMRAQVGPATPQCADAESLAAYSDRSLPTGERERLEMHFADCMRCQVLLADIARADESARSLQSASEVPWYRRWRIAIPTLAGVAALLVFIAIRRPAREGPQNQQVAMAKHEAPVMELAETAPTVAPQSPAAESAKAPVAPAPASAPPASNEIAMNESRTREEPKREAPRMHHFAQAPPAAVPAPRPVEEAGRVVAIAPAAPFVEPSAAPVAQPAPVSKELASNQPQPETAQRAESMSYAATRQLSSKAATGNGAMVAAPERAAPAIAGDTVSQGETAVGSAALGAGAGAIAGAAGGGGGSAAGYGTGNLLGAAPAVGRSSGPEVPPGSGISRQIWAPDRSAVWVIGRNGTIQRYDANGAAHWQHSGVTTDLVAGWAPSARVCWIVGRSGTIIRTTDGEHWERIGAPTTENLSAVSASSAHDVAITTASGKIFATSDGGVTWHRQ